MDRFLNFVFWLGMWGAILAFIAGESLFVRIMSAALMAASIVGDIICWKLYKSIKNDFSFSKDTARAGFVMLAYTIIRHAIYPGVGFFGWLLLIWMTIAALILYGGELIDGGWQCYQRYRAWRLAPWAKQSN